MKGEHTVRSHSFVLDLSAERAFPLFEPEGERAWAEGWDPEYVYPDHGRAEAGMVFTTDHGEHTIWTLVRHEPSSGLVQYLRVTPGSRLATVTVQCAPLGPQRTRVTVAYAYTGLSESGNAYVRDMDEARYRESIDGWARRISAL